LANVGSRSIHKSEETLKIKIIMTFLVDEIIVLQVVEQ